MDRVAVSRLLGELKAIISENGGDLVGHGREHVLQELPDRAPVSLFNELGHRELGCSVHAYEEIEPIVGRTVPRIVF